MAKTIMSRFKPGVRWVFLFLFCLVQIRRLSFSSGGSEAARARASRSDAHRGSPAGSEGLPPPDRVTARHPGAWCYSFKGRLKGVPDGSIDRRPWYSRGVRGCSSAECTPFCLWIWVYSVLLFQLFLPFVIFVDAPSPSAPMNGFAQQAKSMSEDGEDHHEQV
ncbi:hypothetical protein SLEP1_g31599 [Rubroshorea leprosula]|uniref:Transmembrane protein n=1 Tax=Rubroshorea leprosula TaxID=152421 RepID=A0AAV5KB96_9ROSI|nr:hypothetical protein SLEP1_g31599 [Rubroshorea leprosula]